ncbi:MAG: hypothetical protein ACREEM_01670 [Blastocatellia bacterium]
MTDLPGSAPAFGRTAVDDPIETMPENGFELSSMFDKLKELFELPDNWDGYGSPAIQPAVKETASDLANTLHKAGAPLPHIAPVSGGGIQLEWHKKDRELELEILPDGDVAFLKVNESGEMQEATLPRTFYDRVFELVRWFNS